MFVSRKAEPPKDSPLPEVATVYAETHSEVKSVTSIQGTPIRVTYFSQLLNEDDEPRTLDLLLDPTLQQYCKVVNARLMIQGDDFSFQTDISKSTSELSGTAIMYASMIPDVGDMFIYPLEDGRFGLFRITSFVVKTYFTKTPHEVEFKLHQILDDATQQNLELKTVKTVYFNDDTKELTETEQVAVGTPRVLRKLIETYYDEFYDQLTRTFLVPNDRGLRIYDPFVVEFWNEVIEHHIRGTLPRPTEYTMKNGKFQKSLRTVFDLLLRQQHYARNSIYKQMTERSSGEFGNVVVRSSIAYTEIDKVIWPVNEDSLKRGGNDIDNDEEFYIFTNSFYSGDLNTLDDIEKLVDTYIRGLSIDYEQVREVVNKYGELSPLERFYLLPVYFLLIKVSRE